MEGRALLSGVPPGELISLCLDLVFIELEFTRDSGKFRD